MNASPTLLVLFIKEEKIYFLSSKESPLPNTKTLSYKRGALPLGSPLVVKVNHWYDEYE